MALRGSGPAAANLAAARLASAGAARDALLTIESIFNGGFADNVSNRISLACGGSTVLPAQIAAAGIGASSHVSLLKSQKSKA